MNMTLESALAFLRQHQPLPADEALREESLQKLDAVRKFLIAHPHEEALESLLGVFGEGGGFGVYQLIEDAVAAHERPAILAALARNLERGPRSVRYWCAMIAANHPAEQLVPLLARCLRSPGDFDLRYAAATALEAIGTDLAKHALLDWLPSETDPELLELIAEAMNRVRRSSDDWSSESER